MAKRLDFFSKLLYLVAFITGGDNKEMSDNCVDEQSNFSLPGGQSILQEATYHL